MGFTSIRVVWLSRISSGAGDMVSKLDSTIKSLWVRDVLQFIFMKGSFPKHDLPTWYSNLIFLDWCLSCFLEKSYVRGTDHVWPVALLGSSHCRRAQNKEDPVCLLPHIYWHSAQRGVTRPRDLPPHQSDHTSPLVVGTLAKCNRMQFMQGAACWPACRHLMQKCMV